MEQQLSDILDNLLGMLLLEGSYDVEEKDDSFQVSIKTKDAGRLIGARGESLDGLQLLVNQMMFRQTSISEGSESVEAQKRIIIDVEGWRKQKEEELIKSAQAWGKQVLESGQPFELEPQSPWQRRIVHMVISEIKGLVSDSVGESRNRHIVIKSTDQKTQKDSDKSGDQKI